MATTNAAVAQISNLRFCRFLIGSASGLPRRQAGWKPAIRQVGNLRYVAAALRYSIAPLLLVVSAVAADWAVPESPIRFELKITDRPSADCAGIVAVLPDGGLLPPGAFSPIVLDGENKKLSAETLWHNPREGFALVFARPTEGDRVTVYLKPGGRPTGPGSESPFCASLLLYTQVGDASLEAAQRLAAEQPTGKSARFGLVDAIAHMENPFGAEDRYLSYYRGWLDVAKEGAYYFATISDDGSEFRINGNAVAAWPGTHDRSGGAKGQHGKSVTLKAGQYLAEYFHFSTGPTREMHLVWRSPGDSPDALPQTVPASAFVHSGAARIVTAESKSGAPVTAFSSEVAGYLWVQDKPVNLFYLRALFTESHPTNTVYVWDFGDGLQAKGKAVAWLFEGSAPREVTLGAAAGRAGTRSTRSVYAEYTPSRGDANLRSEREDYRVALLWRCRAVTRNRRPCADWSSDLWATLLAVTWPYEGLDLLRDVFERSRADVLTLKTEDRRYLEDVFVDLLRRDDPDRVLPWLERLTKEETDNARRFHWQLTAVDSHLYERDDWKQAKALAESLEGLANAAGPEGAVRLLVRYGDIARLQGKYDDARKLYSQAQDRFQKSRKDWRADAVRQTSFYEMAQAHIEQGLLNEARDVLARWEIEFPLSKLAGDYPIAEAEYYIAAGCRARAARTLRAYRQGVDLTENLPHAMELELECLEKLNRPDQLRELAVDIKKRFPNLELAREADRLLGR